MNQNIEKTLKKYWGYSSFMPLQKRAIDCVVNGRDSIVVLPTGGGKSLCFQAPAVTMSSMAVVVSPLISLMKDQIDGLRECGVPAARIDSSLSFTEQNAVFDMMRRGNLKILYLSPERIVSERFITFLKKIKISFIAVDEAHCVSMWGHDFRPEYRQLGQLKTHFPQTAVHAYTATATEPVRKDIAQQLHLKNPEVIVGSFDRPNLIYKAVRRANKLKQVCSALDRHQGESGIIYCIRRADVEEMCSRLNAIGYRAAPYHAGMDKESRKINQDAFIKEKVDTIVATIAFGMGIDKSNVRYVIHAGMPKSIEHYHQESGRAGRDSLEAECLLLYSGGDYGIWKNILKDMEPEPKNIALRKLNGMYGYCTGVTCRHRAILNYFGQAFEKDNCKSCDVCLGEMDGMDNAPEIARKILSCIKGLRERFGAGYTTLILTGSREQRVMDNGHNALNTYGILSDYSVRDVRGWIEQLVAQGFIKKTEDYNVLKILVKGDLCLKGKEIPRLLKPAKKRGKIFKFAKDSWEGVDTGLFEVLRKLRREIANRKTVPAYVIFGDAALRDMARKKPTGADGFLKISGVGEQKNKQYGAVFLAVIKEYCLANSIETDRVEQIAAS
ncbi:MAG: DNA helicase RecQ [bacterium]